MKMGFPKENNNRIDPRKLIGLFIAITLLTLASISCSGQPSSPPNTRTYSVSTGTESRTPKPTTIIEHFASPSRMTPTIETAPSSRTVTPTKTPAPWIKPTSVPGRTALSPTPTTSPFLNWTASLSPGVYLVYYHNGSLFFSDPQGKQTQKSLKMDDPALILANDQERIAYFPSDRNFQIFNFRTGDYSFGSLPEDIAHVVSRPAWSPDGRYFLISALKNDLSPLPNLFLVSAEDGSLISQRDVQGHEWMDVAWSPDNRWIASTGPSYGEPQIIRLDARCLRQEEYCYPTLSLTEEGGAPSWSPDSDMIYYSCGIRTWVGQNFNYQTDICMVDVEGRNKTNLTNSDDEREGGAMVSPDGKYLAFHSYADGYSERKLIIMSLHDKKRIEIIVESNIETPLFPLFWMSISP